MECPGLSLTQDPLTSVPSVLELHLCACPEPMREALTESSEIDGQVRCLEEQKS